MNLVKVIPRHLNTFDKAKANRVGNDIISARGVLGIVCVARWLVRNATPYFGFATEIMLGMVAVIVRGLKRHAKR